jgi:hypothetical protein
LVDIFCDKACSFAGLICFKAFLQTGLKKVNTEISVQVSDTTMLIKVVLPVTESFPFQLPAKGTKKRGYRIIYYLSPRKLNC